MAEKARPQADTAEKSTFLYSQRALITLCLTPTCAATNQAACERERLQGERGRWGIWGVSANQFGRVYSCVCVRVVRRGGECLTHLTTSQLYERAGVWLWISETTLFISIMNCVLSVTFTGSIDLSMTPSWTAGPLTNTEMLFYHVETKNLFTESIMCIFINAAEEAEEELLSPDIVLPREEQNIETVERIDAPNASMIISLNDLILWEIIFSPSVWLSVNTMSHGSA